jgi:hypothetical protein
LESPRMDTPRARRDFMLREGLQRVNCAAENEGLVENEGKDLGES